MAQWCFTKIWPKNYTNHVTHLLISVGISIFSPEICYFCYIKKYRYRLYFNTYSNSLNFAWVFKGCFNKYGWTFAAKLATLSLPKIMVFWNKVYDVIISVHGVTPKYHHVTQIILQMWLCDQSLITLTFVWEKLS